MSEKTSPETQLRYGVQMVCKAWGFPRSSFYHKQKGKMKQQRGKEPVVKDQELLGAIHECIKESPFSGEGHRKIHARLKHTKAISTGRNRVLKVMKSNHLLSPYRSKQGVSKTHDGRITTDKPNDMWGTDAAKIFTLEDGWVWFFGVLEHWNAECLGWHLTKQGNRFAAIEAMTQAVEHVFGKAMSMIARGVKLRVDHGSQFLSEGFVNQTRYWGVSISKGFVREPETNGVVERFHRTYKEQVVHGRHYHSLEDLRRSTDAFIHQYNKKWLLEKLGYRSPLEARELYMQERNVLKGTTKHMGCKSV
jgi:putative transposase